MNKKKITAIAVVVAAVAIAIVGATLAFFTDTTQIETNTFTVGDVQIELDEASVSEYGEKDGDLRTEEGNEYNLIPGHVYTKDPTVTVLTDSEACYVRLRVTASDVEKLKKAFPQNDERYTDFWQGDMFLLEKVVDGWYNDVWESKTYENGEYIFWYVGPKSTDGVIPRDKDKNTELEPLFTEIVMPEDMTNEEIQALKGFNIKVQADAIQADGFENAAAAWEAFKTATKD